MSDPNIYSSAEVETTGPSIPVATPPGAKPAPDAGPAVGRDDNPAPHPTPSDTSPTAHPTASDSVPLCRHIQEDGAFCRRPALRERHYCYQHLRLRGQQMRMARALAQRQPYRLTLPPLEDLAAVEAALDHVTRAMGLGLLEPRRAGMLLYALRQASCNLRFLSQSNANAARSLPAGEKLDLSQPGAISSQTAAQLHLVQEYPGFEAEFGLPPGVDLSLPLEVAVAAPNPVWTTAATATAAAVTPPADAFSCGPHWTRQDIEREQLEKRYAASGSERDAQQIRKMNQQIEKEVHAENRKQREADWQAEADRRNAVEDEKARQWQSMDSAQQHAFLLGKLEGFQSGQRAAEEELAKIYARRPAAAAARPQPAAEADRA